MAIAAVGGGALAFASAAFTIVPLIIKAGEDVVPFVKSAIDTINKVNGPTPNDWAGLHSTEARLNDIIASAASAAEEAIKEGKAD